MRRSPRPPEDCTLCRDFPTNSKVTLNPHKLKRSFLVEKKKNNVKAR